MILNNYPQPPAPSPSPSTVSPHHTQSMKLSSEEALYTEVAYLEKECKVTDNCLPASECPSGTRTPSARCTDTAELLQIALARCTRLSGAVGCTEGYCFLSASRHGSQANPCTDILPDKATTNHLLSLCGLPSHKRPDCPRSEDSFSSIGAARGQTWVF